MKQKTKVQSEEKEKRMLRPVSEKVEEKTVEEKKVVETGGDDFLEAIASISGPKVVKEKKDKMETIVPSESLRIKIDEFVEAKKKEKEFKAAKENRESDILEYANEKYESNGLNGNFQKSFRLQGVKETVTFVSSDKFSSIKPEEIAVLKELLGDRYAELIEAKTSVSIKEEVFSNPELRKELISYVPKDVFAKFFKAETYYSTTDGFDRKIFTLPKKTFDKIRSMLKQAKASLK